MSEGMEGEYVPLGVLAVFVMILLFIFISTCLESYKIRFGHEASFILLIGIILSGILDYSSWDLQKHHKLIMDYVKFDQNLFFYLCLPPIVFASGFNMHKGQFFSNIDSVLLFGLIGTFVCFTLFSVMTISVIDMWDMSEYNGKTGEKGTLKLQNKECLLMCSLLSSSDVVAAVSLISYEQEPNLYSIVFGEGITNDAVSIILFNTVMRYTSKNSKITWTTPFIIVYEFAKLGMQSLLIGIVIGMLSSIMFKNFRALTMSPTAETMMIFIFGYVSYIISEMTENSGIITLLTSGIIMSHYTWYNLSPQGKHSSFIVFEFLGKLSESFVFIYLGVTFFSFKELRWSWELFLVEVVIIFVGRLFGTIGLLKVFTSCCGMKTSLNIKQQIFVWFAGMIRGAIAFGLVLRLDKQIVNRDVIITTSLSLVIFTTVVFGSLLGVIQKLLFGDPEKKLDQPTKSEKKHHKSQSAEKLKEVEEQKKSQLEEQLLNNQTGSEDSATSSSEEESEEVEIHPNFDDQQMESIMERKKRKYRGCKKYFYRCDKLILKPILIYKYEKQMQKSSREFFMIYKEQGKELEDDYKDRKSSKTIKSVKLNNKKAETDSAVGGSENRMKKKRTTIKKIISNAKNLSTNSPVIPEVAGEQQNDMAPTLEGESAAAAESNQQS